MGHTKAKKQHQEQLLHAVNSAAAVLLAPAGEKDFKASLLEGMEIIGRCVAVDRICIWRNETIDGVFYYASQFHWLSDVARWEKPIMERPYGENPEWKKKFLRDEYINGPVSSLTQQEQAILKPQGVKSLLAIPLYLQGQFYGFFSFDDCRRERTFTEDEVDILRSAGLMMVSAINRNAQAALLQTVNRAASVLLATENERGFEASLLEGMELLGRCVGVDRIHIWRNETIAGALYYVRHYAWVNSVGRQGKLIRTKIRRPYSASPGWEDRFLRSECINGPFSGLSRHEQNLMKRHDIKSLLIIPVHLQEHFWGFVSFGDCCQERAFTEDEVNILRSASLMMISAVNRYEQALKIREAHEHAKLLLDATPLVSQLWDRDGRIFYCNEEAFKVFKLQSKQEYIDRFYDLSPEYQPDGQLSFVKIAMNNVRVLKEGKYVFEWMHQLPDGTPMPSEITLVRVRYGDDYAVAGYMRDLREHKQMMHEIEQRDHMLHAMNRAAAILLQPESEAFGDDLYRCMGMMAEAASADRVYVWKNYTTDGKLYCAQLYEWSEGAEPQQDNDFTMNIAYSERIPGWEKTLSSGHCINSLVRDMSSTVQAQLSAQGILSIFVAPVFVRDQFWGFIGYDDCHRERLFSENEQAILRSGGLLIVNALLRNDNVMEMIRLQAELEAALKEAQKANRAKSNFLANMSHEMRTPLNAIIGLSELALESGETKGESWLNLEKISNAGRTLLSTVNDILDISKIEAGKFELAPSEYDIPSLINDTITQSAMHRGEKPIRFILDIDENLPVRLYGDELRIKQIFNNLLSNAFKYTQEGIVELGVSCASEGDAVWMTVRVRDSGIGIRPKDLDRLFFEYAQMDKELNRKIEGVGLGLPITKRIVELMNGSISVESEYGKGSVFTVRFPQTFVTDAVIGPEVASSLKGLRFSDQKRRENSRLVRISLPYARVLVVDDVQTNIDVTKGMLKPYGMHVDSATSGQQAIDAIRAEKVRYNAVFMDHMMPKWTG